MSEPQSFAVWINSPEGQAIQSAPDERRKRKASARKGRETKARRKASRMHTRDRFGSDPRAFIAWARRGSDRRWRVYHRCQFTGKVGVPLVIGRGPLAKARAIATVAIMRANDGRIPEYRELRYAR